MDTKVQKSEGKTAKKSSRIAAKHVSIRIPLNLKNAAKSLRDEANKKEAGRTIMMDEVFELALSLVKKEHLKMLQERSLTHEDRKEMLRQKYIETRGPISRDEFTGFMMTAAFHEFLKELESGASAPSRVAEVAPLAG